MMMISADPFPFTAADVRALLGLQSDALDLVIEAGIVSICCMSPKPVRREVWALYPQTDVTRYGTPESVGPLYTLGKVQVRNVVYAADLLAVAVAKRRVAEWAMRQRDIEALMHHEKYPNQERISA